MSSLLDAMKQKWNEKISEKKCYLIKLSKKKKTNEEDEGENKKGESRRGGTPPPP